MPYEFPSYHRCASLLLLPPSHAATHATLFPPSHGTHVLSLQHVSALEKKVDTFVELPTAFPF